VAEADGNRTRQGSCDPSTVLKPVAVPLGGCLAEADGNRTRQGSCDPSTVLKTAEPTRRSFASGGESSGRAWACARVLYPGGMSDFGGLIRDAREKLGMSPHRVAELIGRASGTVRAWERGRTVPSDPFVVSSLAAVLAINEETLFRAANLNPPNRHEPLTIEQELATIAPSRPTVAASPTPTTERPAIVADVPSRHHLPGPPRIRSSLSRPFRVPRTSSRKASTRSPRQVPRFSRTCGRAALLFSRSCAHAVPTPPASLRARQNRAPMPAPVPVVPTGSYLDDPEERWSYRLRAVWTAAGVGALGVLLLWAGSRALAAFGETWDALLAGL
jgi:ribosome-binding protein aMBF1 (putative translation factor)